MVISQMITKKNSSPIQVMSAFYKGENVAFRLKSEPDEMWWLCIKPIWNWGVIDYKIIDIEHDDYFW